MEINNVTTLRGDESLEDVTLSVLLLGNQVKSLEERLGLLLDLMIQYCFQQKFVEARKTAGLIWPAILQDACDKSGKMTEPKQPIKFFEGEARIRPGVSLDLNFPDQYKLERILVLYATYMEYVLRYLLDSSPSHGPDSLVVVEYAGLELLSAAHLMSPQNARKWCAVFIQRFITSDQEIRELKTDGLADKVFKQSLREMGNKCIPQKMILNLAAYAKLVRKKQRQEKRKGSFELLKKIEHALTLGFIHLSDDTLRTQVIDVFTALLPEEHDSESCECGRELRNLGKEIARIDKEMVLEGNPYSRVSIAANFLEETRRHHRFLSCHKPDCAKNKRLANALWDLRNLSFDGCVNNEDRQKITEASYAAFVAAITKE